MAKVVVARKGDMHPTRELKIHVQRSGDVVVYITQDGLPIGDTDVGNVHDRAAQVEFCVNGGKSPRTHAVIMGPLIEAMKADSEQYPTR